MIVDALDAAAMLQGRIDDRTASVGIIGLGYVGLPLAMEVASQGYRTVGFDLNLQVVTDLSQGRSHVQEITDERLMQTLTMGCFAVTADAFQLRSCDVVVICVPTPLNKIKDPDLSFVISAAMTVKEILHPGMLVVLESTTYPGTTRDVLLPILNESGLVVGRDFFLCYSPERVDPGNPNWHTSSTPKVIGGTTSACLAAGVALYQTFIDTVVPVSTLEAAELTKVYENMFRMINIALANELAQACQKLGVDVWEVVDAAATKPFGFMKFTPGPGIGGHCIPLDPHYFSWKMRTLAYKTRLIEVASEINAEMPSFVVRQLFSALNDVAKPVRGSLVLILGVTYKRDVGDIRESAALEIIELLEREGAQILYHDPFCPMIDTGHRAATAILRSVDLTDELLERADAVVIVTDHSPIDYARIARKAQLVIDTRGVMRGIVGMARIVGLSGQDGSRIRDDAAVEALA